MQVLHDMSAERYQSSQTCEPTEHPCCCSCCHDMSCCKLYAHSSRHQSSRCHCSQHILEPCVGGPGHRDSWALSNVIVLAIMPPGRGVRHRLVSAPLHQQGLGGQQQQQWRLGCVTVQSGGAAGNIIRLGLLQGQDQGRLLPVCLSACLPLPIHLLQVSLCMTDVSDRATEDISHIFWRSVSSRCLRGHIRLEHCCCSSTDRLLITRESSSSTDRGHPPPPPP
jgi:hypothetical protein